MQISVPIPKDTFHNWSSQHPSAPHPQHSDFEAGNLPIHQKTMNLIYVNTGERSWGFGVLEKFKNLSQGKEEIININ